MKSELSGESVSGILKDKYFDNQVISFSAELFSFSIVFGAHVWKRNWNRFPFIVKSAFQIVFVSIGKTVFDSIYFHSSRQRIYLVQRLVKWFHDKSESVECHSTNNNDTWDSRVSFPSGNLTQFTCTDDCPSDLNSTKCNVRLFYSRYGFHSFLAVSNLMISRSENGMSKKRL